VRLQEEIQATVALTSELGRPSLGEVILMRSHLDLRRQDRLDWLANIFDTPYLALKTQETRR